LDILVVGSVGIDTITTPHGKAEGVLGGSASHFSCAASFFAPVKLVGVVGTDFPGEYIDVLKARGVDLEGLQVCPGETFRWSGDYTVDYNKAHTLETRLNVFATFNPILPESYRDAKIVFLANIDPELQTQVLAQVRSPSLVVGDTMNYWIETKRESVFDVFKRLDVALVNDQEARDLAETYSLIDAGRILLKKGPKQVVIKKGEHGALLFQGDELFFAPAYPYGTVTDPTGAGDSFAGGFVGHLARTGEFSPLSLRQAVIHGSVMGSLNVEDFSVRRILRATDGDIRDRYKSFQDLVRFWR